MTNRTHRLLYTHVDSTYIWTIFSKGYRVVKIVRW